MSCVPGTLFATPPPCFFGPLSRFELTPRSSPHALPLNCLVMGQFVSLKRGFAAFDDA